MSGELPPAARAAVGADACEAPRRAHETGPSALIRLFSTRTRWDRTANELSRALALRRASGGDLLDLTESNPTRAGISYPPGLLETLADPRGLVYEPTPAGQAAARQAIAAEYARHGLTVAPEHVLLTASSSEAYAFVFKLLCDPGDEILIPAPSYPLFDFLAGLESVTVKPYPLLLAGGEWHVDTAGVAPLRTPRTRALVIVNPNNPTGSFLKKDEAAALALTAAEGELALVADEVFLDFANGPDDRRLGSLAGTNDVLVFTLGGLSKSCGLPQLKLGWMVVSGPEGARREALERLEIIADTYLSVGTPVQLAVPELLSRGAEVRRAIAARVGSNRALLESALRGGPATVVPAEGGWYAVLRVPSTRSEEALVVALAAEHGVAVHPGFFFGFPQEAYLVVSLLCQPDVLAEGARRLARVL